VILAGSWLLWPPIIQISFPTCQSLSMMLQQLETLNKQNWASNSSVPELVEYVPGRQLLHVSASGAPESNVFQPSDLDKCTLKKDKRQACIFLDEIQITHQSIYKVTVQGPCFIIRLLSMVNIRAIPIYNSISFPPNRGVSQISESLMAGPTD
jgi:hypothetical protein